MKKWTCVQVGHHKEIGEVIARYEEKGWKLNTYQVTGRDVWITHYLLFEKETSS